MTVSCKKPKKPVKKPAEKVARMPLEFILRRKGKKVSFQITRQDGKVIKRGKGTCRENRFHKNRFMIASYGYPELRQTEIFLRGDQPTRDKDVATQECRTVSIAQRYVTRLRAALKAYNKHLLEPKDTKK